MPSDGSVEGAEPFPGGQHTIDKPPQPSHRTARPCVPQSRELLAGERQRPAFVEAAIAHRVAEQVGGKIWEMLDTWFRNRRMRQRSRSGADWRSTLFAVTTQMTWDRSTDASR